MISKNALINHGMNKCREIEDPEIGGFCRGFFLAVELIFPLVESLTIISGKHETLCVDDLEDAQFDANEALETLAKQMEQKQRAEKAEAELKRLSERYSRQAKKYWESGIYNEVKELQEQNAKLTEKLQLAIEALEHLAESNYAITDNGFGYTTKNVCVELYTDKEIDVWAREALAKIKAKG